MRPRIVPGGNEMHDEFAALPVLVEAPPSGRGRFVSQGPVQHEFLNPPTDTGLQPLRISTGIQHRKSSFAHNLSMPDEGDKRQLDFMIDDTPRRDTEGMEDVLLVIVENEAAMRQSEHAVAVGAHAGKQAGAAG